uniref:Uncharacterized protein n=1 Tax=Anguilla anguilla TaxID=7936 RepID=A0A0E9S8X6_ANGAN
MAGMPSCEVTPWRGSMPHTYTALRVCHFFLQKLTTLITDSQTLKTFISVPSDHISTDRIHKQLHMSTQ